MNEICMSNFIGAITHLHWLCKIRQVLAVAGPLRWRHNERDGVSNQQPHDCLLNRLFRRRSKKRPKLCVTGLCEGKSPVTDEFPAQKDSNAETMPIRRRRHMEMSVPLQNKQCKNIFVQLIDDYWITDYLIYFIFDFEIMSWRILMQNQIDSIKNHGLVKVWFHCTVHALRW